MKDYNIKKSYTMKSLIKLFQSVTLAGIPILIIFTLLMCTSEKVQRFIIPNPPLSMFDEMLGPTLLPCIINYILLYINMNLYKRYIKHDYIKKSIFIICLTRIYIMINTTFFIYYFYMGYIYDVGMWHLFKLY